MANDNLDERLALRMTKEQVLGEIAIAEGMIHDGVEGYYTKLELCKDWLTLLAALRSMEAELAKPFHDGLYALGLRHGLQRAIASLGEK